MEFNASRREVGRFGRMPTFFDPNSPETQREWATFLQRREELMNQIFERTQARNIYAQFGPTTTDPRLNLENLDAADEMLLTEKITAATSGESPPTPGNFVPDNRGQLGQSEYNDLLGAARYYGIREAEDHDPEFLQWRVEQERLGSQRFGEGTEGGFIPAMVVAGKVLYSGAIGGLIDMSQRIPFIGDFLAQTETIQDADQWLGSIAESTRAAMPEDADVNWRVAHSLSGMLGYLLPATATWKMASYGLGLRTFTLGEKGAEVAKAMGVAAKAGDTFKGWTGLGARLNPMLRSATQGGASMWMMEGGGDAPLSQRAMLIGLGALGGGAFEHSNKAAVAAILGPVGGAIGYNVTEDRTGAIAGAAIGIALPFLAVKAQRSFRSRYSPYTVDHGAATGLPPELGPAPRPRPGPRTPPPDEAPIPEAVWDFADDAAATGTLSPPTAAVQPGGRSPRQTRTIGPERQLGTAERNQLNRMEDEIRSLTEQRNLARRAAEEHPISGLPNRRAFELARPEADADPAWEWVVMDARGFKKVNDVFGHDQGDEVLAEFGSSLQDAARALEIPERIFHFGGDEFAAVVPAGAGQDFARRVQATTRFDLDAGRKRVRDLDEIELTVSTHLDAAVGQTFDEADMNLINMKEANRGFELSADPSFPGTGRTIPGFEDLGQIRVAEFPADQLFGFQDPNVIPLDIHIPGLDAFADQGPSALAAYYPDTQHLEVDIPRLTERGAVGTAGIRALGGEVIAQVEALGYSVETVGGHRISGANPERELILPASRFRRDRGVTREDAGLEAAALTKQQQVIESPALDEIAQNPVWDDYDAIVAAEATNPGETSVVRGVQPQAVMERLQGETPLSGSDMKVAYRGDRADVLVRRGGVPDWQVDQYEANGFFVGQRALVGGQEVTIQSIGRETVSVQPTYASHGFNMEVMRSRGFNVDLPLYHGTHRSFEEFRSGKNDAIYLTDDPSIAETYTLEPFIGDVSAAPQIRPIYAKMENPLEVDFAGIEDYRSASAIVQQAREQGHDSVILRNVIDAGPPPADLDDVPGFEGFYEVPQTQYVIFKPENIISQFESVPPGRFVSVPKDRIAPRNSSFGTDVPEELLFDFERWAVGELNREARVAGLGVMELTGPEMSSQLPRYLDQWFEQAGFPVEMKPQFIEAETARRMEQLRQALAPEEWAEARREINDASTLLQQRFDSGIYIPTPLEDMARARGFRYVPHDDGMTGVLRHQHSSLEIPTESEAAAWEFLMDADMELPDIGPISEIPAESMEFVPGGETPTEGVSIPFAGDAQAVEALEAQLKSTQQDLTNINANALRRSAGGGGQQPPPPPPPGAPQPAPRPEPERRGAQMARVMQEDAARRREIEQLLHNATEPVSMVPSGGGGGTPTGRDFARLRRDDPNRFNQLLRELDSFRLRWLEPLRNFMLQSQEMMQDYGISNEIWRQHAAVSNNVMVAHNAMGPVQKEWADIVGDFGSKIRRDGTVVRIEQISNFNDKLRAMEEAGYSPKEMEAQAQIRPFFDRLWGEAWQTDPNIGYIFDYLPALRRFQEMDDPNADPYQRWQDGLPQGWKWFARYPRAYGVQATHADVGSLGSIYIRGLYFEKHVAPAWNEMKRDWSDPRIPEAIRIPVQGWLDLVLTGMGPQNETLVTGFRHALNKVGVPVTDGEVRGMWGGLFGTMYRAGLGLSPYHIFRDAIQPLHTGTEIGFTWIAGAYKDWLYGSMDTKREMMDFALRNGWVERGQTQVALSDVFTAPTETAAGAATLSPKLQGRRESLAQILDVLYDTTPKGLKQGVQGTLLDPLLGYTKLGEFNRLMAGWAGYKKAQSAATDFMTGKIGFERFARRSGATFYPKPIEDQWRALVEGGNIEEANVLLAQEAANSQFRYGTKEQSIRIQQAGVKGKIGMMYGTFTTQYAARMRDALTRGRGIGGGNGGIGGVGGGGLGNAMRPDAMAFLARQSALWGIVTGASAVTGWYGFERWKHYKSLTFAGGPLLQSSIETFQAGTGVVSTVFGERPDPAQRSSMAQFGMRGFDMVNPVRGAINTAAGIAEGLTSPWPVGETAEFLLTGDRGQGQRFKNFFDQDFEFTRGAATPAEIEATRRLAPPDEINDLLNNRDRTRGNGGVVFDTRQEPPEITEMRRLRNSILAALETGSGDLFANSPELYYDENGVPQQRARPQTDMMERTMRTLAQADSAIAAWERENAPGGGAMQ